MVRPIAIAGTACALLLTSCSFPPRSVYQNLTGHDVTITLSSATQNHLRDGSLSIPIANGQTSDVFPVVARLDRMVELEGCTYHYDAGDDIFGALPAPDVSFPHGSRSPWRYVLDSDMTLRVWPSERAVKNGWPDFEILTGEFPVVPQVDCGSV